MRSDFKGSGREGGSGEPPITAATPTDGERVAAAAGFLRLPRAGRCLVGVFLGAGPKIVTVAHPSAGSFSEFICRLQIFLYFSSSRLQTGANS